MGCSNQGSTPATRSVVVVLLMFGLMFTGGDATVADWGYRSEEGNGPETWHENFPDCGGVMQSPVNINTNNVVYDPNLGPFDLSDYSITDNVHMKLANVQGHTAEVIVSGRPLYIKGGSLPARYIMEQFHFHWGHTNSRGSEHSINSRFASLEAHFVHRQERFPNITIASVKPHGVAVLAFTFKVGRTNHKYDQLLEHFSKIPKANDETEIETFPIKDLIPFSKFDYYRYLGSLTTPPCYESVTWTVAVVPIEISSEQLERFRALRDSQGHHLVDDYRPIQNLNHRTVTATIGYTK